MTVSHSGFDLTVTPAILRELEFTEFGRMRRSQEGQQFLQRYSRSRHIFLSLYGRLVTVLPRHLISVHWGGTYQSYVKITLRTQGRTEDGYLDITVSNGRFAIYIKGPSSFQGPTVMLSHHSTPVLSEEDWDLIYTSLEKTQR